MVRTFLSLVGLMCTVMFLTGCMVSSNDEDELNAAGLLKESKERTLGPDLCRIQTWAAQSIAVAQNRNPEAANLDRVAWNLAQTRTASLLENDPGLAREVAVDLVAAELSQLYTNPLMDECKLMHNHAQDESAITTAE